MTNKERQESLDKARWIASEKAMRDCGGQFAHCKGCTYRSTPIPNTTYMPDYHCNAAYDLRLKEFPCATAYNKFYKKRKKNENS